MKGKSIYIGDIEKESGREETHLDTLSFSMALMRHRKGGTQWESETARHRLPEPWTEIKIRKRRGI